MIYSAPSGGKVVAKLPKGVHFHERSEVCLFFRPQGGCLVL